MYFALAKEAQQRQSPSFLVVELLLVQDPIAQQMMSLLDRHVGLTVCLSLSYSLSHISQFL